MGYGFAKRTRARFRGCRPWTSTLWICLLSWTATGVDMLTVEEVAPQFVDRILLAPGLFASCVQPDFGGACKA